MDVGAGNARSGVVANFTCSIESSNRRQILIDFEDLALVSGYTWRVSTWGNSKGLYAFRLARVGKKYTTVSMHSMIMDRPEGSIIDHKNCNGLDNRRFNLRACSKSQNAANAGRHKDNTSGFKGVSFCKSRAKYETNINKDGKRRRLGRFNDPIDAALAYNKAAIELFGEFARPNEIPEIEKRERLAA